MLCIVFVCSKAWVATVILPYWGCPWHDRFPIMVVCPSSFLMLDLVTEGSGDGLGLGNAEEEESRHIWAGGAWAPGRWLAKGWAPLNSKGVSESHLVRVVSRMVFRILIEVCCWCWKTLNLLNLKTVICEMGCSYLVLEISMRLTEIIGFLIVPPLNAWRRSYIFILLWFLKLWEYVHVSAGACRGQKRVSDPLGLELQGVVNGLKSVLGTEA